MTETDDARADEQSATTILDHWVDGAAGRAHPPARRPSTTPRSAPCRSEVRLASTADVDAAVASAPRAFGAVARRLDREAPDGAVRVPRAAERPQAGARRDPHLRARQGASPTRSARSRAASRSSSSPAACRAPDEGRRTPRTSRPASTSTRSRQPLGVVGHHQPVQLPGDGAAVVLPDRDRRRQRRGPQALREGPDAPRSGWPRS